MHPRMIYAEDHSPAFVDIAALPPTAGTQRPCHQHLPPSKPPIPQTGPKTLWNKLIPSTLSKIGFVIGFVRPKKSFAPITHKNAQKRPKVPNRKAPESPRRRVAVSPRRPPYRRNTLPSGSSTTFTGVPGTGTLNVTPPSAVRTQCVKVFPCPN
jgi:hypothetical protein